MAGRTQLGKRFEQFDGRYAPAAMSSTGTLGERVREIAERVAAEFADDVDQQARFPTETIEALRGSGVLGALVTSDRGGLELPLAEVASAVSAVAEHCASSGLILAMHQIQVACVLRHGSAGALEIVVPRLLSGDLLLANANSEIGLGGNLRASECALEPTADGFKLEKRAATVSYGEYADGILVTARRRPDSVPGDQVMAICLAPNVSLETLGEWDTLGMRGTCSKPAALSAMLAPEMVIEDYPDLFLRTSQGYSAILLSAVWLGIAEAAGARAHGSVRDQARKRGPRERDETPPVGALRLAELAVLLHQLREVVSGGIAHYESVKDSEEVTTLTSAGQLASLKVASSTLLLEIVQRALLICGLPAYKALSQNEGFGW